MLGDININFLQYCNTDNAADYPDMEFDLGCMPIITKTIRDKHAVLRKLSNKKRKQLRKPWKTSAILKSIKNRQKLFMTPFFLSNRNKLM